MANITRQMCSHPKSLANLLQGICDRLDDLEAVQTKDFKGAAKRKGVRQARNDAKANAKQQEQQAEDDAEAAETKARLKIEAEEDAALAAETDRLEQVERAKVRAAVSSGEKGDQE